MAETAEETRLCGHCGKQIASQSFMLHEVHCQRNFFKCTCGAFLNKSERESHEATEHKPQQCEHCRITLPAYEMAKHKCPKLPKTCNFCNAVIIFDDYVEHIQVCGSRTQLCPTCKKYIQAWQYERHEATCVPEPIPEPVRPQPQKSNRFLDHQRIRAEVDAKTAVAERKTRPEEDKKSAARSDPPWRPVVTKPVETAPKPAEAVARPTRVAAPAIPQKVMPSESSKPAGPGGKSGTAVKSAVAAPKSSAAKKPSEWKHVVPNPAKGRHPGPRISNSPPIPIKAPDSNYGRGLSYEDEAEELISEFPGHVKEDEQLAKAMVESMEDADPICARKPAKEHSKPVVEDEDEDIARALAASEVEEGQLKAKRSPRPDPHSLTKNPRQNLEDEAYARAIQESLGGEDWAADEDPEMNEVILQSLREK